MADQQRLVSRGPTEVRGMNKVIDYAKIAVIAWASIYCINRLLKAAGLSQYAATPNGGAASSSASS
jgi:hypothetical protein